jgi:predicted Zn-ribbon and HTH transcriptional regulator
MDKLVTIAIFYEPFQAHLAKYRLKTKGIQSVITGENFVAAYWLVAIADNGIKLKVRACDAERAAKILESKEPSAPADFEQSNSEASESELSTPRCPRCKSENTEYQPFSRSLFFLSILLLRFPLPWKIKQYKCSNCGHKWKTEKPANH